MWSCLVVELPVVGVVRWKEQRRWWVAVRKTVFGSLVRGSVVGSVEAEFEASGGLKEEEGCAAAVKEVE